MNFVVPGEPPDAGTHVRWCGGPGECIPATVLNAAPADSRLQRLERVVVMMDAGEVTAVGRDVLLPEDSTVLDVGCAYVLPGHVDSCTRLGVREEGG